MTEWKRATVSPGDSIRNAIKKLDASGLQIVLVTLEDRLLGTVTDGDVRRSLLRNVPLDNPIADIMNRQPQVMRQGDSLQQARQRMRDQRIHQLPVLDENDSLVDLLLLDDLVAVETQPAVVVLMAGGLGKRLRPMTYETPKPLLHVGGKPLLQTIIEALVDQGFRDIYLSLNYKAELFEEHFGDGSRFGAEIKYVREDEPRGTAGALSLLPERPEVPIIVMNGDLLTSINFGNLLRFHRESSALATMCIREYAVQVPYGVIQIEKDRLTKIIEKPSHEFFINAGIYALSPKALDHLPRDGFFDMPTLFTRLIDRGLEAAAFPIREYWLDIGQIEDLERARGEYASIFG